MSERVNQKEWACLIYSAELCRESHWRASQPNWKGDPYPAGHDRCGWVTIPDPPDKEFADHE